MKLQIILASLLTACGSAESSSPEPTPDTTTDGSSATTEKSDVIPVNSKTMEISRIDLTQAGCSVKWTKGFALEASYKAFVVADCGGGYKAYGFDVVDGKASEYKELAACSDLAVASMSVEKADSNYVLGYVCHTFDTKMGWIATPNWEGKSDWIKLQVKILDEKLTELSTPIEKTIAASDISAKVNIAWNAGLKKTLIDWASDVFMLNEKGELLSTAPSLAGKTGPLFTYNLVAESSYFVSNNFTYGCTRYTSNAKMTEHSANARVHNQDAFDNRMHIKGSNGYTFMYHFYLKAFILAKRKTGECDFQSFSQRAKKEDKPDALGQQDKFFDTTTVTKAKFAVLMQPETKGLVILRPEDKDGALDFGSTLVVTNEEVSSGSFVKAKLGNYEVFYTTAAGSVLFATVK